MATSNDSEITGISIPPGARAVLVSVDDDTGKLKSQPIVMGQSILDIKRDLLKHLNEYPHSTEWLEVLRDYCDGRIKACRAARASGSFITPSARFDWDMTSIAEAR